MKMLKVLGGGNKSYLGFGWQEIKVTITVVGREQKSRWLWSEGCTSAKKKPRWSAGRKNKYNCGRQERTATTIVAGREGQLLQLWPAGKDSYYNCGRQGRTATTIVAGREGQLLQLWSAGKDSYYNCGRQGRTATTIVVGRMPTLLIYGR